MQAQADNQEIANGSPDQLGLQWCRAISNLDAKQKIANKVADRANDGDVIGVGSGSTSFLTALALGQRARDGLDIFVVPTSIEIELACLAAGLKVTDNVDHQIDWCFDGADEVDPQGRLIKGRGGAIYRERLVFSASQHRIIVADMSKSVERLGIHFPVPVEIEPKWLRSAFVCIQEMNHVTSAELRMGVAKDGPVITEFGRVIVDVKMSEISDADEQHLLSLPGVCCTGIFSGFDFERIAE